MRLHVGLQVGVLVEADGRGDLLVGLLAHLLLLGLGDERDLLAAGGRVRGAGGARDARGREGGGGPASDGAPAAGGHYGIVTLSVCAGPRGLWSLAANWTMIPCAPGFNPWKLSLRAVVAMMGPSSTW